MKFSLFENAALKKAEAEAKRLAGRLRGMSRSQIQALGVSGLMALGFTAEQAQAAIDVTTAVQGVTDAQTAILSVIAALMTLATTLFGIMMVYRFLNRKSGVH